MKKKFHVDDLLKSVKNSKNGIDAYNDFKMLLSLGGLNLTKWNGNNFEVINAVPEEDRSKEWKKIDFKRDSLPVERALGVQWNTAKNCFQYSVNIPEK